MGSANQKSSRYERMLLFIFAGYNSKQAYKYFILKYILKFNGVSGIEVYSLFFIQIAINKYEWVNLLSGLL